MTGTAGVTAGTMGTETPGTPGTTDQQDQQRPAETRERRVRPSLILVALGFVAVLVFSSVRLAERIDGFNSERGAPVHAFIQVATTEFEFYDHPVVIEEGTDAGGADVIRVTYGEGEDASELELPVEITPRHQLPTLYDRHMDWLTVLVFGDRSGMGFDAFEEKISTGEIPPRLVIATRSPFGAEPMKEKRFENIEHERDWMWGESRRDLWLFRFYELLPDGSVLAHQPLRFPESGKSLARRQNYADLRGDEVPSREPGELAEYTWQYGAALKLSPRPPAITMENQALREAGWTLPVSAAAVLGVFVSLFFAFAPVRQR